MGLALTIGPRTGGARFTAAPCIYLAGGGDNESELGHDKNTQKGEQKRTARLPPPPRRRITTRRTKWDGVMRGRGGEPSLESGAAVAIPHASITIRPFSCCTASYPNGKFVERRRTERKDNNTACSACLASLGTRNHCGMTGHAGADMTLRIYDTFARQFTKVTMDDA